MRYQYTDRALLSLVPFSTNITISTISTISTNAALSLQPRALLLLNRLEEADSMLIPDPSCDGGLQRDQQLISVQNLEPVLVLPEGWRTTSPLPLELSPEDTDMVYLGFIVPREALAGECTVGFTAAAEAHTGASAASADSLHHCRSIPAGNRTGTYSLSRSC